MKNKLVDLNNHLFAQLERLGDEDLSAEQLEQEVNKMVISDYHRAFVETFGRHDVKLVNLNQLRMSKGVTTITFGTNEPIDPKGTVRLGLIVWMDRKRVADLIAADKAGRT